MLIPNMSPASLAAAGVVLLLLYLTGRFLWLYNKDAAQAQAQAQAQDAAAAAASSSASRRTPAAAAGAASSSSSLAAAATAPPLPRRGAPLSSSSSSSSLLPVFFVVLRVAAAPGPGVETAECAVCLAELEEREAGRLLLLPCCGHAFHEECISTWLRVSTTCPLCRAPVAVGTTNK